VVTAKDNGGNTTQRSISYRVISPTPVTQNYTAISGQPNVIPITCNQLVVPFSQRIPAVVAAPPVVPENQTFQFRFAAGAMSVPPSTVASNVKYVIAPPVRGTVTDAQVVPNTGTANTASSFASIVNGRATLALPAVDGGVTGASFTPPQMLVTIKATAVPPAEVTTAFERYQVRLTTGQQGVNILTTDYDCPGGASGTPNPVLTRTATTDVTPPVVALRTPVHGGRYRVGQSVIADFSCSDVRALSSCVGTVADGQPINTSSTGARTFTVTAKDATGNVTTALASYKTFNGVTVNVAFTATERSQLDAAAAAFNTTPENLITAVIYLLGLRLDANLNPAPLSGPPPATRTSILTFRYLPNDAALIDYQASRYALTSPNYHWFAGMLGVAIWQLYGGG
jgi:hypothetical protein